MIHYALRCTNGHAFDGWFNSSASFEAQAASGLLDCPVCATRQVERALMAPNLRTGAPAAAPKDPEATTTTAVATTQSTSVAAQPSTMPDGVRAMLQRVRAEVEARCDYVGPRFAEEARRIHEGGEAPRPIFGEATAEEAQALAEDGIEVAQIPWVPRADG